MNESYDEHPGVTNKFDVGGFSRDAFIYAVGQGILLIIGFIQGLVIPKYLSLETYGYWQVFLLYAGYVGVLHLGFTEGIFIRWAGKDIHNFGTEMSSAFKFLVFEQLAVVAGLSLMTVLFLNTEYRYIGLMVLAYSIIMNLVAFFIYVTQSIKKFKIVILGMIGQGIIFLSSIILIFILGYSSYNILIYAYLFAAVLTLIFYASYYSKYLWSNNDSVKAIWTYGKNTIKLAFFLYISLFVFVLSWTVDRLIVSANFSLEQFAVYAFALSCAAIILSFTMAVSNVFFPYISNAIGALKIEVYKLIKPTIIFCWAAILVIFFPLKIIISFFLPQYTLSLKIIVILFCVIGFSSVISVLHVNYYRAYRKQIQFFVASLIALVTLVVLNFIAIKFIGTLEGVAIATFVGFSVWYCINEFNFKRIIGQDGKILMRDLTSILIYSLIFWFSASVINTLYWGLVLYSAGFLLITYIFFRNEIKNLVLIYKNNRKQTN